MSTTRDSARAEADHADAMNALDRARSTPGPDTSHLGHAQQLSGLSATFTADAGQELPKTARDVHRSLQRHLADAARAANDVSADHEGIGDRPPSDRKWARDRARERAIEHRRKAVDALDAAAGAVEVLHAELVSAAIPAVPADAADAKDELRMMLTSKAAKADVLALAKEERYAGLLAGSWGKAYLRSIGQGDLHDAVRRAIAGKAGPQGVAARKAVVTARASISHRLRAHGLDGL
jgi:hypothetical protein